MAENDGVKAGEVAKPQVTQNGTDSRGVPWENVAKEYERKLGELQGQMQAMGQVVGRQAQMFQPDPEVMRERARTEAIKKFAENPEAFVQAKVDEAKTQLEAQAAAKWIQDKKSFKRELEPEIARTINEYGLLGSPMQKAKAAWKLLKADKPELFQQEMSNPEETRSKGIAQVRTEGPGRTGSDNAPVAARTELLKRLSQLEGAGNSNPLEKASILNQLTRNSFEGGIPQD